MPEKLKQTCNPHKKAGYTLQNINVSDFMKIHLKSCRNLNNYV